VYIFLYFKHTVYTITNYYPEVIIGDGSEPEKLWPWYLLDDKDRKHSNFGELITKLYDNTQSRLLFLIKLKSIIYILIE
jgi:hypothetical protein